METSPTQKRILYVITKSNFGGAQRYVFELALAMHKLGHDVAVACGGQGELVERLRAQKIHTYEIEGFQRDISFFKDLKAIWSLRKVIHQFSPDIVHVNSAKAGLLGSLTARLLGISRVIFTVHGWTFLEDRSGAWKFMAWAGSYLTNLLSHKIIMVSHHDLSNSHMIGIKNKSTLIHTTVNNFFLYDRQEARHKLFSADDIENHQHNIWLVTTAELNANKNHKEAINAVAEFNSTHSTKIFYSIIGEGELLSDLREQVDFRGLKDHVCFLGQIKDARQYLLAFDAFILPSKKEGLPYSLLEAGQAGLPCIASQVGGIGEVIEEKISGRLTDPDNHNTIVKALDEIINYPDRRTRYSSNLTDHIHTNFSHSEMIDKTKKVYFL
ncbi:MAG: glycosyltransferase family 4 protein [Candidatus Nomurabacteria bacterium]|nr:glycosyltransferase family 4 protein [Candidatus Nomurabacteria bacterium]USN88169.1 MAG: glycosyltransferase family 4 protein [Candidatus Nomurabacteria bacterium]